MSKKPGNIGQRRSSRRDAILTVLKATSSALTPEQIHQAAQEHAPGLGIATVYRNLKLLQEADLISPLILPDGQSRFELADKTHHHHFQCDSCGQAFCLDGCILGHAHAPKLPEGFVVSGHEITYYGSCPKCSDKG